MNLNKILTRHKNRFVCDISYTNWTNDIAYGSHKIVISDTLTNKEYIIRPPSLRLISDILMDIDRYLFSIIEDERDEKLNKIIDERNERN